MPPKPTFPKGAISQSKVFYNEKWTKSIDRKFIEALVDQVATGNFHVGNHNSNAIFNAMSVVNAHFNTQFDFAYCVQRVRKLHKRYQVFNWIRNLSGVVHDPVSHNVSADNWLWDYICREEKLGAAYMLQGEADFDALRCIFIEDVDSESLNSSEEVIVISSDTDNQLEQEITEHNNRVAAFENQSDNTDNSFWNELAWY